MKQNDLASLIIDKPQEGTFLVSRRLFTDESIFLAEMKNIFENNWIYVLHESQLKQPGDFFTTKIGKRSVFFIRGNDGIIRGFLNSCPHHGAKVCVTEKGQVKYLTCPYHGWVFNREGHNVDIKEKEKGKYPTTFLSQSHHLLPVPKVESYRGFVFASLNSNVQSLKEHLAGAATFIDLIVDQSQDGIEILSGTSSYTHRGNWKFQTENGIDGYHFTSVHANYVQLIMQQMQKRVSKEKLVRPFDDSLLAHKNGWYDFGNGHALMWASFPLPENRPIYTKYEELKARLGQIKADWIVFRQRNLLIYPNLFLMEHASSQIRVIHPLKVDKTLVKIHAFGPIGEDEKNREKRIRQYEDFFNATGLATPDDVAVFELAHDGMESTEDFLQGYERGLADVTWGPDDLAKELGFNPIASGKDLEDEVMLQGQYRQWLKLMA